MPQAKAAVGTLTSYLAIVWSLLRSTSLAAGQAPRPQWLFGRWQMLCLAPRHSSQLTQTGATSSGWRWTQVNKSVGWQVWQSYTYTVISTGNEKTIKPDIEGLWDRMNHSSNDSQTQGASVSPLFFFPPTLSSYLIPLLMLIKPVFPRSWFNSLTWQESNPAIKRLSRFLLAFGAFESRKVWVVPRLAVTKATRITCIPVPTTGSREPSDLIVLMKPHWLNMKRPS